MIGRGRRCALVGLLAAVSCAPDLPDAVAPSVVPPAPGETRIVAIDNSFRPDHLEIAAGTEVVFVNAGINLHNILSVEGTWGVSEQDFAPGSQYSYRFATPGEFRYWCDIHGTKDAGMVGTITVTPAASEQTTTAPGTTSTSSTVPTTSAAPPPTTAAARADGHLDVPADFPTIQAAVDAAQPGDLVLIAAGTYHEAVTVVTDRLTIRGIDRNTVVLDGEFSKRNGFRVVEADGVAIENLTVMDYAYNGVLWTGVTGYRGSYLTAYRNGGYGLYAFDSTGGLLDHDYAAGSPDGGFYIGQCFPCDAVIDRSVSEHNGLGYSGTNAGGNLFIVNSIFRFNRVGIAPNTHTYELCYPQRGATIAGNLVYSNNEADTPAIEPALLAMGNGILVGGGVLDVVYHNRVFDHDKVGIGLVPYPDLKPRGVEPPPADWTRTCAEQKQDPDPDPLTVPSQILFDAKQNVVRENVVERSRLADLGVGAVGVDPSTLGNCFEGNAYTTTRPAELETLAPCTGTGTGDWAVDALDVASWLTESHPPSVDYRTATFALTAQPTMPDAATAPARPATDVPPAVDITTIPVPAEPA